jgi:hypothetical protein
MKIYQPIVTGSLTVTNDTTSSVIIKSLPSSSTVTNVVLYDSSSGQLYYTASTGIGGGSGAGVTFPFTGSAVITGSIVLTGSFTQTASTASFGGRVGIGTNTPIRTLHVSGTMFVINTQTGSTILPNDNTTTYIKYASTGDAITDSTNYAPILALHNANNPTSAGLRYNMISFQHGNALGSTEPVGIARIGTRKTSGANGTDTVADFRGDFFIQLRNGSNLNEVMYISSSGNFGISTITPAFRLDVSGSGRFTNGLTVSGSLSASGSNHTITGSLRVSGGITGSLEGTASWAQNAVAANNGGVTSIVGTSGIFTSTTTGNITISPTNPFTQLLYVFSQTSTNRPGIPSNPSTVVSPIINTITDDNADFVWTRVGDGEYLLTGNGAGAGVFDQDKTVIYLTPGTSTGFKYNFNCQYEWINSSQITIYSVELATLQQTDGMFKNAILDIRIY